MFNDEGGGGALTWQNCTAKQTSGVVAVNVVRQEKGGLSRGQVPSEGEM